MIEAGGGHRCHLCPGADVTWNECGNQIYVDWSSTKARQGFVLG
jgi:hypothetical protein